MAVQSCVQRSKLSRLKHVTETKGQQILEKAMNWATSKLHTKNKVTELNELAETEDIMLMPIVHLFQNSITTSKRVEENKCNCGILALFIF